MFCLFFLLGNLRFLKPHTHEELFLPKLLWTPYLRRNCPGSDDLVDVWVIQLCVLEVCWVILVEIKHEDAALRDCLFE